MKTLSLILAASIALTTSSFAGKKAKGAKAGKGGARVGAVVKEYDANSNHSIDGDEVQKLKAAFAKAEALKALDKNGNGALDDDEITALNARLAKRAGKAGGKKKK